MTLKSLLNWGGLTKSGSAPSERWHHEWEHEHKHQPGYSKGEKGSAALSALALLAFLFLINVMQQSLNEFNVNNSIPNPTNTAVLLRDDNMPVVVTNDKDDEKLRELKKVDGGKRKGSVVFVKGDTLG